MFFFGFLLLLCAMQLPGLPIFRSVAGIPGVVLRLLPTLGFVAGLGAFMATGDGSGRVMGILGIPMAEWAIGYFVTRRTDPHHAETQKPCFFVRLRSQASDRRAFACP